MRQPTFHKATCDVCQNVRADLVVITSAPPLLNDLSLLGSPVHRAAFCFTCLVSALEVLRPGGQWIVATDQRTP